MSYEFKISAKDRASGRFIGAVKKALMRAAFEEKARSNVTQQSIAAKLGVNRSVVNRILKGETNLTLRSVAEIAWALGWEINFSLSRIGSRETPLAPATESRGVVLYPPMNAYTHPEPTSASSASATSASPITFQDAA